MHPEHQGVAAGTQRGLVLDAAERIVRERLHRTHATRALTVRTRIREELAEALPRALSRHLDQPQLGDPQDVRAGLVLPHRVLQRLEDPLAVRGLLHVDEVDHDDAAEVSQAELRYDLLRRFVFGAITGMLMV